MQEIHDLRSALDALSRNGYPLESIIEAIDPNVALIEDYLDSYRSRSCHWMTAAQPVRLYEHPTAGNFPVLLGVFGSRDRLRLLLDPSGEYDATVSNAAILMDAILNPRLPRGLDEPTKRVVIEQPDLHATLPVLTYSHGDPGPTITMGLVYARDARTGASNCSVHRITVKDSTLVIGTSPAGHLQRLIDLHAARGERLPISINIGIDPAIYIASALSQPALQFGDDELSVAGAIRKREIELAPCFSNSGFFIDHAEIVIEATIGGETEAEAEATARNPKVSGLSMPEYLGYYSPCGKVPTVRVDALTHRPNAIYQTVSGPGREQSELLGCGQETAIYRVLWEAGLSDLVHDVVAQPAGGGHLLTVLQMNKRSSSDDERVRQAGAEILRKVSSTKNLVLVDGDVDAQSSDDVLWAMATRFRADADLVVTEPLKGTPLDPTQSPLYLAGSRSGFTGKCVLDCTVPFVLRDRFRRAFTA